jgi:type I restriction enzyme S subunit
MNAERLLAHYQRVADAPDAIGRLRRFILDLAVRGKLVPQNPNDDPASKLLERITAEKSCRKKRELTIPKVEGMGDLGTLPRNWFAAPLIALGEWAIGSGFHKNEQGLEEGPYFFLKVSDMNLPGNEKYITASNNCIDEAAATRMRAKIHPPGTIIFPKIGGAIATNKRRILTRGAAIDNNCLGITFSKELNVEWAYLLMTSLDFTRYQAGTAVPALQQSVLEIIPVAVPPLAEQHRIVAKVDELMALCDRLETARVEREKRRDRFTKASLFRLNDPDSDPRNFAAYVGFALNNLQALTTRPDQIKHLRQTILNLAVRGKLVTQNPNDEPSSELLRRIKTERARLLTAGVIPRQKDPVRNLAKLTEELPASWSKMALGQVCNLVTSGSRGWAEFYSTYGPGFIRAQNIRFGKLRLDDLAFVNPPSNSEGSRTQVAKGDLLIVITGAGVTNPALLDHDLGEAYVSQHVIPPNLRIDLWDPGIGA